ncbi:MAG: DNA polymerase I [Muribaculaceae bacterium]|nr:DNA polymerase I [Muribaculaceae bacterium]
MSEKRLFLLDAYALIFRAYYALIKMPRMTSDGFNTSAIFGFVNTLEEVLRKERPTHIAVCFDPKGPTFRSELLESYKGERPDTPEDIKRSIPIIKEIIKCYGIPVLESPGYEADDVIGTMATRASKEGFTTYMMTPDKDFGQLVGPNVIQYKPAYRGQDFELRGEKEVCERYGIERTSQVIDLLALMGDKIDNIPGCPGVGEKTAQKLIADFGTAEDVIARSSELKGALRKKIEENAATIMLSKDLATIRTDVPVDATPESLALGKPDKDKLFAIFKELEFKSLIDRIGRRLMAEESPTTPVGNRPGDKAKTSRKQAAEQPSLFDFDNENEAEDTAPGIEPSAAGSLGAECVEVTDAVALKAMAVAIAEAPAVGLYMETVGENDMEAVWNGTAFALTDGRTWHIARSVEGADETVLRILADPKVEKVSWAAKRDMVTARRHRTDRDSDPISMVNFYDTTIAHYLLEPEMRHNPELLAEKYLGYAISSTPHAAELAALALKLKETFAPALEREGLTRIMTEIELPLVPVLADMEYTGVRIDTSALAAAAEGMEDRSRQLCAEIFAIAGEEFNVGSPAQVGEILFGKMQLDPKAKKTKTGQYSTSEEILEKLAWKSPIIGKILEYRQIKKLLNTYLNALPETINKTTGKIHTNYNQTVTSTGRLSSSSPNLQNIPVRDEMGRDIRRAFIPDPGHLFLSADYSQIELRLVADFAKDETMIEAFRKGDDIHAITAAKINHVPLEEVTADERRKAKTANFGILYGITAFGLASRLQIPRQEAKELIDGYFATFPSIHKYMSDSVEEARENGYAVTRLGRKRRLPDINSKNPVVRGYAERNAINAPVQGTAADVIKLAMVGIWQEMQERHLKSKMIMQVHDELNFDVVPGEEGELQEIVERRMEEAYDGAVPLTASAGIGANWLEAH